jgi:hypothetical protein
MKKFSFLWLIGLLLLSTLLIAPSVSAWTDSSFTKDNGKIAEKGDTTTNYGKYVIEEIAPVLGIKVIEKNKAIKIRKEKCKTKR